MKAGFLLCVSLLVVIASACGPGPGPATPAMTAAAESAPAEPVTAAMPLVLTSSAFEPGASIPVQSTCDGDDMSPPLEWSAPPSGTRSLALLVDDPDAGGYVHWILYDLPPDARNLPEARPQDPELPDGSRQGQNGWGEIGYGGPCPPGGKAHRYSFVLYALDGRLELSPGAKKAELLQAMERHILTQAELIGLYARQP